MTGEIMTSRGLQLVLSDRNQLLPNFKMPVHCIIYYSIYLDPYSKPTKELPLSPFFKTKKERQNKTKQ